MGINIVHSPSLKPNDEPKAPPWSATGIVKPIEYNYVVRPPFEPVPFGLAEARANSKSK